MTNTTETAPRLFWYPGTCARVAYVALQEIGLPYSVELVDKPAGPQAAYLKINPKDKVPALQLGERVVTENPAIQTLMARRHPDACLLPVDGDAG